MHGFSFEVLLLIKLEKVGKAVFAISQKCKLRIGPMFNRDASEHTIPLDLKTS